MATTDKPTIERIDHGVIPSNDLGRAHRFYGTFMGGEIDHLTNLKIRGLNREVPQIVFYTLANHKGWGVALQDFPISATPVAAIGRRRLRLRSRGGKFIRRSSAPPKSAS